MGFYEMRFAVDGSTSAGGTDGGANVRIWLDSQPDADLDSERELPLQRSDDDVWSAAFAINDGSDRSFLYRVGVRATPGAVWSLEVREAGSPGPALLCDSDTVVMPKEWLVGTCGGSKTPAEVG